MAVASVATTETAAAATTTATVASHCDNGRRAIQLKPSPPRVDGATRRQRGATQRGPTTVSAIKPAACCVATRSMIAWTCRRLVRFAWLTRLGGAGLPMLPFAAVACWWPSATRRRQTPRRWCLGACQPRWRWSCQTKQNK
jgi:hypothetical protein